MTKLKIKKGDTVIVNTGKDAGKKGKVLAVLVKENKVLVEGVNIRTKHVKARKQGEESGIVKSEAPINASNVNIFCEKCNKGVKVAVKVSENGEKTRVCKKCQEEIK